MVLYHTEDLAIIYNDFTKNFLQTLLKPSSWHWKFWDGKQEKPDKNDLNLDPYEPAIHMSVDYRAFSE
jgi:hypothetical protein